LKQKLNFVQIVKGLFCSRIMKTSSSKVTEKSDSIKKFSVTSLTYLKSNKKFSVTSLT
jgi:hypothetical protein